MVSVARERTEREKDSTMNLMQEAAGGRGRDNYNCRARCKLSVDITEQRRRVEIYTGAMDQIIVETQRCHDNNDDVIEAAKDWALVNGLVARTNSKLEGMGSFSDFEITID